MRRKKGDGDAAIGLVVVLIVALIVVAIAAAVALIPWKAMNIDEKRDVAKVSGIEQMSVTINSTIGQVDVSFADLTDNLAQLTVEGREYVGLFTDDAPFNLNFSSTSSIDGKNLNIVADVWIDQASGISFNNLVTSMVLDSSIPSHVNVISQTGQISLTAGSGAILNGANLQATAGTITMTLGEGANLTGNVTMVTTTGTVRLDWNNAEANELTHMTLGATAGAVEASIAQHSNVRGNVTISAIATTGSVSLTTDISDGNAARVLSASGFDNVNVERSVGFTGSNNDLSSTNYLEAQVHRFDFLLSVNTGAIDLSLEYTSA